MKDGSFVIVGITKPMRNASAKNQSIYNNDIYLTKFDREGNITCKRRLAGLVLIGRVQSL